MDDHTTRGRDFITLDHERTASSHCAATRENTKCATRAARATANALMVTIPQCPTVATPDGCVTVASL